MLDFDYKLQPNVYFLLILKILQNVNKKLNYRLYCNFLGILLAFSSCIYLIAFMILTEILSI